MLSEWDERTLVAGPGERLLYTEKSDMYQLGKLMLARELPQQPALFIGGLSEEARTFAALLMREDAAARLTAEEALRHPWIGGCQGDALCNVVGRYTAANAE